jgi:hypothetical protein
VCGVGKRWVGGLWLSKDEKKKKERIEEKTEKKG